DAVLERIVAEDVAESRRDQRADAGVDERVDRAFARRAAPEIVLDQQDARLLGAGAVERKLGVEHAVGIAADVVEEELVVPLLAVGLDEARRNDLVGVAIDAG